MCPRQCQCAPHRQPACMHVCICICIYIYIYIYTHTHTYTHIYIYAYILCECVNVHLCVSIGLYTMDRRPMCIHACAAHTHTHTGYACVWQLRPQRFKLSSDILSKVHILEKPMFVYHVSVRVRRHDCAWLCRRVVPNVIRASVWAVTARACHWYRFRCAHIHTHRTHRIHTYVCMYPNTGIIYLYIYICIYIYI